MIGPHGKKFNFSSGWVDTEGRWFQQFGRFEVNASLPSREATGIWPAHWLMPNPATATPKDVCWPVGGEIDIMEVCSAKAGPSGARWVLLYVRGTDAWLLWLWDSTRPTTS